MAVRYAEGVVHGFLTLSTLDGTVIAAGDSAQSVRGNRVTSRLIFHFKDGSLQDETTVFSQAGHFRLISDRLIQRGAAFKVQMDLSLNAATGESTARYTEENGKEKTETVRLKLPPDIGNGMIPYLLKNLAPDTPINVPMVIAAPKPMLVRLAITPEGADTFSVAGSPRKATRYVAKIEIPGVKGVLATVLGKEPPDTLIWILHDSTPTFLRSDGPSCAGCASWRTQLASPAWPKATEDAAADRRK